MGNGNSKTLGDRARKRPRGRLELERGCCTPVEGFYEDWVDKPADPDDLVGKKRRVARAMVIGKSLNFVNITEALNRGVPKQYQITWQELTRFNWKTAIPAEVNWYLWLYLGPHLKRTHDHKNYSFRGDPADLGVDYAQPIHHSQFIWVPEYDPPPPTRRIPAERKKKIVIDEQGCPYRDKAATECKRASWPGGAKLKCSGDLKAISRSPAKPDPVRFVELQSTAPEKNVSAELQQIKAVNLSVFRWLVYRVIKPGPKDGLPTFATEPVEMITQIVLDFQESVGRDVDKSKAKKFSGRPAKPKAIPAIAGHALRSGQGATELGAAAKTIRDLFAVGMLAKIVLRAYEDRATARTLLEREAFTEERATWVFDALRKGYFLPLAKHEEGVTGVAAEVAAIQRAGSIPVVVKGCGAGDALGGVRDERFRVAILEYETRKPRPPAAIETQKILQWDLYESFDGGQVRRIVHSGRSNAVALDEATVESFRSEVRPFLVLLSDVDEKRTKRPIEEVTKEIGGWDCASAEDAKAIFSSGTPKLTPRYWAPNSKDVKLGHSIAEEAAVASKVWLDPNTQADPNHLRVLAEYSTCSASPDVMQHVELLVGTKYRTHSRIHFE